MKAVVILFSLLAAGMAAPECRWGASYWCQSKATAERCGQVAYCEKEVWKGQVEAKAPDADDCDICKIVVGYVDKLVEANATESEAEKLVDDLCGALGALSSECQLLVNEFFPQIWKLLLSELDPTKVCTVLGLCTSGVKTQAPEDLCSDCKEAAELLDSLLENNATEAEVKAAIEALCADIPSIAAECKSFVDTYFDLAWEVLLGELKGGQICTLLGLCTNASKPFVKTQSDALCDLCNGVQDGLKFVVELSGTEGEVKSAAEKLCGLLPGNASTECKSFVDAYFGIIWGVIKSEVENGNLCKDIGFCTSTSRFTKLPVHLKDSPLCEGCELLQKYLAAELTTSTEKELQSDLEALCQKLGSEAAECKQVVDTYLPMLWKLVMSYVGDPNICSEIGLCTTTTKVAEPENEVECVLCEFVLKELESLVNNSSTEQEIIDAVEKVCSFLPKTLSSECDSFVEEYGKMILDMLVQKADPKAVCTLIKLCSAAQQGHPLKMIINRPYL